MPILRSGEIVDNPWVLLKRDTEPAAGTALVVPSDIWRADRDRYLKWHGPLGIRLDPADDVAAIAHDLGRFELIEIDLPSYKDGRGYSSARILREHLGYTGELRAVGDILRDQFLFLDRCGFDTLEMDEDQVSGWRSALSEISISYQPATDARTPVLERRHHREAAE